MIIRPARLSDVPDILAIYNHAVIHTTATADYDEQTLETREAWFQARTQKGFPVLVADDQGRIVGWSCLNPFHDRVGYRFTTENSVYVADGERGRRVGTLLLEKLLEAAPASGAHCIVARIDSQNLSSIRLHENFGFVQTGILKEAVFKFDRWLDVVYMQKFV